MASVKQSPEKIEPEVKSGEQALTLEEWYLHVQEAAYYLAESGGFTRDPVEYWLEAEESMLEIKPGKQ